jgi:hypothetical protein
MGGDGLFISVDVVAGAVSSVMMAELSQIGEEVPDFRIPRCMVPGGGTAHIHSHNPAHWFIVQ